MYQIEWVQAVLEQLATFWTDADVASREAITAAASQIDKNLCTDPQAQGESREANRRTLYVAPLGIDFHVEEENRKAVVVRVWLVRKRKA